MAPRPAMLLLALLMSASAARAADPAAPQTPATTPPPTTLPAPPPPSATPPAAAHQELIYQGEATRILGRIVIDPAGSEVGRIVDILVDDQGVPKAVLIDFGGFMGVGNRRIAVAWRALKFLPAVQQHQIRLDMTVDQIKETPDYKPAARPDAPPVTMAVPPPAPGIPASGK